MAFTGISWIISPHQTGFLSSGQQRMVKLRQMISRKLNANKWKKTVLYALVGTLLSAILAIALYQLSGQGLYLAIIGLGAGLGFAIGS
jgi:hypothetical protein